MLPALQFATMICWSVFLISAQASAQTYPSRFIRIVASAPPGGVQDALARHVAKDLAAKVGQPVIVENRPGANTMLAAQFVAEAPADGYTLLMASDSTLSINPHLYSKISYDPEKDFVPVSQLVVSYQHLFVNAEIPVRSLAELVAYVKLRPGKLNYGSMGYGSNAHLGGARLGQVADIDIFHIPFKGNTEQMIALSTNQIQLMISSLNPAIPLIDSKKVNALAVSGSSRVPSLPDVPTFAEAGYPKMESRFWFGLVARRGTPAPIVQLLSGHVNGYIKSPDFKEIAPRYVFDVVASTPEEFGNFLKRDREQYRQLIADNKIEKID